MSVPGNLYTPTIRKTRGADYLIEQSLRFNDDDTAYLNRTPSVAGNRKTWTFSAWVKRGNLPASQTRLLSCGPDASNKTQIEFMSDSTLRVVHIDTGLATSSLNTSAVFRDPSAWYHIVVVWDTTNATANNRHRIYVNGVEQTSFGTRTNPSLNLESDINSTNPHVLGADAAAGSNYFDGLMALPILVDGAALDPTSFGEEDADGYWNPIEFTGATVANFVPSGTYAALIGDMTDDGGLAASFDDDLTQLNSEGSKSTVGLSTSNCNVGKQFSASKKITQVCITGSTDRGYASGNYTGSLTIYLKSSNSGIGVSETTHDSVTFNNSNATNPKTLTGDGSSATYWWVEIQGATGELGLMAEVQMYEEATASYGTNGGQYDFAATAAFGADVKTNTNTMTPTFEAQYFDTSNLTTYTFSACDLGTADADRSIIVAVGAGRATAGSRTVSSLTIGGVSATFAGRKQSVNLSANEIWYAKVPTGATGDVVVTFNAGMIACGIGIWSVLNLGPVQDVQGDNTSGFVASQSVSIGGGEGAFAVFNVYDEGEMTAVSWSTATERYEDLANEANSRNAMGADYTFSASSNATTVTAAYTGTGGHDGSLLGVTFGKPNDNFYKANNFTTADQLEDTPTDSTANETGNFATLNPLHKRSGVTLSDGNLRAAFSGGDVQAVLSTIPLPDNDLIYIEVLWNTYAGDAGIGLLDGSLVSGNWFTDTNSRPDGLNNRDGFAINDADGHYVDASGRISLTAPSTGQYQQLAVNTTNGKVWYGINNTWLNSGDPAAGTGEVGTFDAANIAAGFFFYIGGRLGANATVNFGQRAFNYTPPTGFSGFSTADFAAPSLTDPYVTSFTGNANAEGPFVYIGGAPDQYGKATINGNAIIWGTHAQPTAGGLKLITSSTDYNTSGSNTPSIDVGLALQGEGGDAQQSRAQFAINPGVFTYTGADQTYVVPDGVTRIAVKMWGAGGGDRSSAGGGGGGFVEGELAVTPGEELTIIVGQGGDNGASPDPSIVAYGGGGRGTNSSGGFTSTTRGGAGGGRSAIRRGSTELATAGAGGGSATGGGDQGGPGGGLTGGAGQDGSRGGPGGTGGSQVAGGTAGGAAFAGGDGSGVYCGGGGGGYYGGGGGQINRSGAGGGSSYIDGFVNDGSQTLTRSTSSGSGTTAGGTSDGWYPGSVGNGGTSQGPGQNGYVHIYTIS